jgi:hypothetical protein
LRAEFVLPFHARGLMILRPRLDLRTLRHIEPRDQSRSRSPRFALRLPNHDVDVFFVKLYVGSTAGLSPVNGPCNKDAKGMDGSVVEVISGLTGTILAHEVGHYLGLSHVANDSTNLMFPNVPNGGRLTSAQGATMRSHCFIEP